MDTDAVVTAEPVLWASPDEIWIAEPEAAEIPIRWRSDPRFQREPVAWGDSLPVYLAAAGGTVLAGGSFGVALVAIQVLGHPLSANELGAALAVSVVAAIMGCIFAGAAAVFVFPIVGAIQCLGGLYRQRAVMAALAGGCSGLAATVAMTNPRGVDGALAMTLLAMAMGQAGAAWAASKAKGWQRATSAWGQDEGRAQFSLQQLLGLTAGTALAATIVSSLPIDPATQTVVLGCVAVQALGTAAYYFAAEVRRRTAGRTANRRLPAVQRFT